MSGDWRERGRVLRVAEGCVGGWWAVGCVGAAQYGGVVGYEGGSDGGVVGVGGVGGAEEDGADGGSGVEGEVGMVLDEVGEVLGAGADAVDDVAESLSSEGAECGGD